VGTKTLQSVEGMNGVALVSGVDHQPTHWDKSLKKQNLPKTDLGLSTATMMKCWDALGRMDRLRPDPNAESNHGTRAVVAVLCCRGQRSAAIRHLRSGHEPQVLDWLRDAGRCGGRALQTKLQPKPNLRQWSARSPVHRPHSTVLRHPVDPRPTDAFLAGHILTTSTNIRRSTGQCSYAQLRET